MRSALSIERTAADADPVARREGYARGLVLLAALISFVLSISLWFTGSELEGVFVGLWVPSILALGAFLLPRSTR